MRGGRENHNFSKVDDQQALASRVLKFKVGHTEFTQPVLRTGLNPRASLRAAGRAAVGLRPAGSSVRHKPTDPLLPNLVAIKL